MSETDEPSQPPLRSAPPRKSRTGTPLPYIPRLPGSAGGAEDPLPVLPDPNADPSATPPPLDLASARRRRSLLSDTPTAEVPAADPTPTIDLRKAATQAGRLDPVALPDTPLFLDEVNAATSPAGAPQPAATPAPDQTERDESAATHGVGTWTLALAGVILLGLMAIGWLGFALVSQSPALKASPRTVPAMQRVRDAVPELTPEPPTAAPVLPAAPAPEGASRPRPANAAPASSSAAPAKPAAEPLTPKETRRQERARRRKARQDDAPASTSEVPEPPPDPIAPPKLEPKPVQPTTPPEPENPWGALAPERP